VAGIDSARPAAWISSTPTGVLIRKVDQYAVSPVVLSESARKSRLSEAQQRRRKGERKKALADSWERYKAKQREAA
jgi:hypothetical protein